MDDVLPVVIPVAVIEPTDTTLAVRANVGRGL